MRTDPAMSVPTPRMEPRILRSAPSPPVEPPAVRDSLLGLRVRPKRLFSESAVIIVWGRLVLTYLTIVSLAIIDFWHGMMGNDLRYGTCFEQYLHNGRVDRCGWSFGVGDVAYSCVCTDDVEAVF